MTLEHGHGPMKCGNCNSRTFIVLVEQEAKDVSQKNNDRTILSEKIIRLVCSRCGRVYK